MDGCDNHFPAYYILQFLLVLILITIRRSFLFTLNRKDIKYVKIQSKRNPINAPTNPTLDGRILPIKRQNNPPRQRLFITAGNNSRTLQVSRMSAQIPKSKDITFRRNPSELPWENETWSAYENNLFTQYELYGSTNRRIRSCEHRLNAFKNAYSGLQRQLKDAEGAITVLRSKVDSLETQLKNITETPNSALQTPTRKLKSKCGMSDIQLKGFLRSVFKKS